MPDAVAAPTAPAATNAAETTAGESTAPKAPEAKPEPRKLPQAVELKVKGKVEKVDDLDRLVHLAQKGYGASEYFEGGRKAREEAEAKLAKYGRLKSEKSSDLLEVLTEELGDEEKALTRLEEILFEKRVKTAQLTPEQRRIRELEAAEAKRKADDEARQAKERETKETETADAELNRWSKAAFEALQAAKVSPDLAPAVLARMKPYIDRAIELGQDPVGTDIFEDFMADERASFRSIADGMEAEALVEWLGEAAANKIRKWDLARLRAGREPRPAAQPPQQASQNVGITNDADARKKQRRDFWDVPPHRG